MYINEKALKCIVDSTSCDLNLKKYYIGEVNLKTGKIFAGDPCILDSSKDLDITVPINKYPSFIFKTDINRNAFAMLKFNDLEVVSWQIATYGDQDIESLEVDYYFGYPVDTGLGCFMDMETHDILEKMQDENIDLNIYDELIDEPYCESEIEAINYFLENDSIHNIIIFSSGYGDGYYPSYWGLDKEGTPCCLITDFLITPL